MYEDNVNTCTLTMDNKMLYLISVIDNIFLGISSILYFIWPYEAGLCLFYRRENQGLERLDHEHKILWLGTRVFLDALKSKDFLSECHKALSSI